MYLCQIRCSLRGIGRSMASKTLFFLLWYFVNRAICKGISRLEAGLCLVKVGNRVGFDCRWGWGCWFLDEMVEIKDGRQGGLSLCHEKVSWSLNIRSCFRWYHEGHTIPITIYSRSHLARTIHHPSLINCVFHFPVTHTIWRRRYSLEHHLVESCIKNRRDRFFVFLDPSEFRKVRQMCTSRRRSSPGRSTPTSRTRLGLFFPVTPMIQVTIIIGIIFLSPIKLAFWWNRIILASTRCG